MEVNNQPGNNNNRPRIVAVITVLGFIISFVIGVVSSQGSAYNIVSITIAIAGTFFAFLQVLPSISISIRRPSIPKLNINTRSFPQYILLICSFIMLIVMIAQAFLRYTYIPSIIADQCSSSVVKPNSPSAPFNTYVSEAPDHECIGISDGGFSFDTNTLERENNYPSLKSHVLSLLAKGHYDEAKAMWESANVTNDAEMLIYLENQHVLESSAPYINIVVATILTGFDFNIGRDNIQGAYVAQKEVNDGCILPQCTKIRLLIANSGSALTSGDRATYASNLANLIVGKTQSYKIAGVIGWPFSGQAESAEQVLAPAHIPMISPTSSSESLSNTSYFWRVAPPDSLQARAAVPFVLNKLQAQSVAVFYDSTDPYSQSLGNAFLNTFEAKTHTTPIIENYTIGKATEDSMQSLLRDALKQAPTLDLIYFAGYANDASPLLDILPTKPPYENLRVMGGDALYVTGSYRSGSYPPNSFDHLYFTAFAYQDEWKQEMTTIPKFFCEYTQAFSPQTACPVPEADLRYHYSRASSDVILSYDATMLFASAAKIVLANTTRFNPDDIQQALMKMQQNHDTIQGVSGQITLDANGNPIDKAVVVLKVDNQGKEVFENVQGCYLQSSCRNELSK